MSSNKRRIYISWGDLTQTAKDNIIECIKEQFVDQCKVEGQEFLTREWFDIVPKTWVEAYVRTYDISWLMWHDYVTGADTVNIPDWQGYFDDYVDQKLNTKLGKIITNLPIEVEI